jgi:benzoyl-CoA 2,3-dioxygenase component B
MLKEEAHHMFVGASGIGRVVQRTVDLMKEHDTDDVREFGAIDIATLQRYLNFHYTVSLDLFGSETSTNAANYFAAGLKGRHQEDTRPDDHRLVDDTRPLLGFEDGEIVDLRVPSLSALNATLRDDFVADCQKGVDRWNRALAQVDAELRLPHIGFNRAVGRFSGAHISPKGDVLTAEEFAAHEDEWLPTDADREFVHSLMKPVHTPGQMASWIAAPNSGIHGKPVDFEYVRV